MGQILIGADFVPTQSNYQMFSEGNIKELFGDELVSILNDAEYRIFNLETPLTDKDAPISKQGPRLSAPTSAIKVYKATGVDLLTLANNHILDQGVQGLESTVELLEKNNISFIGVGDAYKAAAPFIVNALGKVIGVYACAEHEFSIVNEKHLGANPFDPLESLDHISSLKQKCDYVIVLYHGGKEHYPYPSPMLQKRCRKMVEKGADLIICQHSHCIGCEEKYQGGTIVYGQGNFLFDHKDIECWQTGLLVAVDDELRISYIPIAKNGNTVRLADDKTRDIILKDFYDRGQMIQKDGFIEESYSSFAIEYRDKYLYALGGRESVLFRALNKISDNRLRKRRIQKRYGETQFLAIQNYVECEAHRELLLKGLEQD